MPKRLKLRQAAFFTGIVVLLTYQNCAQQPESTDNTTSSYQSGLPFAYTEKVDTIAYMSCSDVKDPVDPRAYFTFRVGAYNAQTGGLGLTDAFRTDTQYYSTQNRARALGVSDLNSNTLLNLSIRTRTNLQAIWAQGELQSGQAIDSFLPPLDGNEIAGALAGLQPGERRNYFPGSGEKRLMEASLRFMEFENVAKETRANLSGAGTKAYLVTGYSGSADEVDQTLRSPDTEPRHAYGTGFALEFGLPKQYTAGEGRALKGVTEYDLTSSANTPRAANWDCNQNYQFMIIRPEDVKAGKVICRRGPDTYANATQMAALAAIRRVLRVEDWWVDMNNSCVVPKRTGDYCYAGGLGGRAVQYGSSSCPTTTAFVCPHFVSVCIRF